LARELEGIGKNHRRTHILMLLAAQLKKWFIEFGAKALLEKILF